MDFLSAIVGPVVESLLVPVKKHLGFLFSSTKHVRSMSTKMKQLDGTSHDVKNHMETNNISNLEIPDRVPDWLKEVEKIKEDAERIISSDVNGCCNLKMRYRTGRKAFKNTQEIEALIKENIETIWRDAPKPLGKVSSKLVSTSDGDAQNDFKSREESFKEALGLLQQDQKAQVIALCGMGGVGKTTMMEQLKKAVENKKMFDYVVKVVIGQKVNTLSIQQTVAQYIGHPLPETDKTARADRLRITFEKISQESKKKVLVILDDVWEMVELKDIGLRPLPNDSKLLLTSRNSDICKQIAVEANSDFKVVRVDVMEKLEANNFFSQITGVSKENDPELNDIGVEIVRRCGFLPLAIKLIARALHSQEKFVWKTTLHRLKENDLDENVQQIIEISYTFLKEEEVRAIFLLCGLFPDDFDIPIEDLTRYAWGLELLKKFPTLGDARNMTKTCVRILKDANLLIDSDHSECVKMHDLVLAFVVDKVSKSDHPWIIKHGDVSNWSRAEKSESCKRISLTCMGMFEFPRDFNYPNVSLLRLMNGHKSLKFSEDFYEKMKNLQVMAYEKLQYPLFPRSLQCSSKLQTLCLHQCSLMSDCSPIGDHLLNLEVLSFAHSGIRYLPSAIGNLVKLKLLDLTGCIDLRIDEGVLKNLVKLEELYMTVSKKQGVRFTDINYKELAERSKNLSAFDFEFFEKNPQSRNMSYNKLERFSISMGRFLQYGGDVHKSDNRLMLVANKDELLESGMNELFSKTEVLYLEAVGTKNLEEVLPKSVPRHSSFFNLRVLRVSRCADLRYLFTVPVARGLVKLERLTVEECPVMEALVYSENGEEGVDIGFYNLRVLDVSECANLRYLFTVPVARGLVKLERLTVKKCPVMKALVYSENGEEGVDIGFYNLRVLDVSECANLRYLFTVPVARGLVKLERLTVKKCPVMEALVDSENGEEQVDIGLYNLKVLSVSECANLRYLFTVPVARGLVKLESLTVEKCPVMEALVDSENGEEGVDIGFYNLGVLDVSECANWRYLFTVPVARGLVKLERLTVKKCHVMEALVYSENGEEGVDIRFQELKYLFLHKLPMLVGLFNTNDEIDLPQLVELKLWDLPNITSIFPAEYKSAAETSSVNKPLFNKQAMIPPKLEILNISDMEALKNIWEPCGSSQEVDATCLLREIEVRRCDNLVNMFPSNPMPLLHHLETIWVESCGSIEVLFDIDVGCIGEIKEGSSKLRSIGVYRSGKLSELWRLKGEGVVKTTYSSDDLIICGCFQAVEKVHIVGCKRFTRNIFRNIFTSTAARYDLRALTHFYIDYIHQAIERNQEEEVSK